MSLASLQPRPFRLLDPDIDGTELIPLQQIAQHMSELNAHKNEKVIVHCRSGARSMQCATSKHSKTLT